MGSAHACSCDQADDKQDAAGASDAAVVVDVSVLACSHDPVAEDATAVRHLDQLAHSADGPSSVEGLGHASPATAVQKSTSDTSITADEVPELGHGPPFLAAELSTPTLSEQKSSDSLDAEPTTEPSGSAQVSREPAPSLSAEKVDAVSAPLPKKAPGAKQKKAPGVKAKSKPKANNQTKATQKETVLPEQESTAPVPVSTPAEGEATGLTDRANPMADTDTGIKKPRAETFMITLNNAAGEQVGLDVTPFDMHKVKIDKIKDGLINSWNLANPSQCVQAGDSIVSINSVSGDVKKMLSEFKMKASLSVQIERAPVGSHGGSKSQTQKTKGGVKGGVKEEVTQRKANPEEAAQWKANPKAKSRLKSGPPKVTVEMAWQVIRDTKPILEKPENLSRLKREIKNCENDDELNEMMNMAERLLPLVWGMVGRIFKKHGFKDDRQMFGALLQFKELAKKDDPLKAEVEIVMHMLGQKM